MTDKKPQPAAAPVAETAPATAQPTAKVVATDNNKNGYLAARREARKSGVKQ